MKDAEQAWKERKGYGQERAEPERRPTPETKPPEDFEYRSNLIEIEPNVFIQKEESWK